MTNKANQMIGLIKRSFDYLDKDVFLKLYKALIRPHLEYGNIIWHPHLKRQSAAIEKVQRRATKLLKCCKQMSYLERLQYLNLPSLKHRRERGDLIETFKIFHGHVDISFNTLFIERVDDRTRNSDGKLYVPFSSNKLRKNFFTNRVINPWNALTTNIKFAQNTNSFINLFDADTKFKESFYCYDD